MKSLRAFLNDRRRSQRGSVLSAVLILVVFLAIISGALTTALSTNFLLSTNLVNRVYTEATVNSAAELGIRQLQTLSLYAGQCPSPAVTPPLNGQTAAASVGSCWPTVYEPAKFSSLANGSSPFSLDGAHAQFSGLNDYVVGNPDGTVFDYDYDSRSLRWTLPLAGSAVTGPPLVMDDPGNNGQFLDLIPTSGPACSPNTYCVSVLSDDGSKNKPRLGCPVQATGGPVVTQPAASSSSAHIAFFGSGADIDSIDLTDCEPAPHTTIPGGKPVVARPVAVPCKSACNGNTYEVYAVVSDSGSSSLVRYRYPNGFASPPAQVVSLPWGGAIGLAISGTTPPEIAITFQGGGVALVQLASNGTATLTHSKQIPAAIGRAPYWCTKCGDLIGVGTQSGLYVLDTLLNVYAFPPPNSPSISTTPQADGRGNYWYFGADNGFVYEAQVAAGRPVMTYGKPFGPMAQFASSVQVGDCQNNTLVCVSLGAVDNNAYVVPLDARDSVLTACITVAPPACSLGVNPRVWTNVEVGMVGNAQAVHVQGWSYYSP